MKPFKVIIETGKKRVFGSAFEWPGWSRSGRDEAGALQALLDYGTRYAQVLEQAGIEFRNPAALSEFVVVERVQGGSGTDFGAPEVPGEAEQAPLDSDELERFKQLLQACWQAFDRAVGQAQGKVLRTGPRGGGRDLEKIVEHVLGADRAYLRRLAWSPPKGEEQSLEVASRQTREAIRVALDSAVQNGLPDQGPRGGKIWSPRYFVRRVAWHVLDHAWEIQDRVTRSRLQRGDLNGA